MSRGTPSMVALLGLLAVAGYQNRDKFVDALAGRRQPPIGGSHPDQQSTILEKLGGLLSGRSPGGLLTGGLRELIERFSENGQAHAVNSWVSPGPNHRLRSDELARAIGPDVLTTLSDHTGLSNDELLARLTRDLPTAVDELTPDGRLPNDDEAARLR